jgi:hypothetical protein
MKITITCRTCGHKHEVEACNTCKGSGYTFSATFAQDGRESCGVAIKRCPHCSGTGITSTLAAAEAVGSRESIAAICRRARRLGRE